MINVIEDLISQKLSISKRNTAATINLLSQGSTIPFISRYRKEATGNLDEVSVEMIQLEYKRLLELEKRKVTILETIREQGKLTESLAKKIADSWDASALEDLYLPFKPKRKTKASVARNNGLEPLAKLIIRQDKYNIDNEAARFVQGEITSTEEALQGARDIIAEWVSESPFARDKMRQFFSGTAFITSKVIKGKEIEGQKFRDYFTFSEQLKKCPSHRMLAIRRGATEGYLRISIQPDQARALEALERIFIKRNGESADQISLAIVDSYKRLLGASIESELKKSSKTKADGEAIDVFAENLRQLLLAPPAGPHKILAIDPGFRTGCKLVVLDRAGNLVLHKTIFPHPPMHKRKEASDLIFKLLQEFNPTVIAIGNATAGRETESFINSLIPDHENIEIYMVNEAGASVYSASLVARQEFPDLDVTVRGAISIGRRLMDPLAELVKIDPKSIGVGQYQHDVDQKLLKERLDRVVESCVNLVGVNLNTASHHLLAYVSGIGPKLAEKITQWRDKNGGFQSRSQLKKVPGLGSKAFEQCAGFLRIPESENPLDKSAVHPESYPLVHRIAKDIGCSIEDLVQHEERINQIDISKYVNDHVGVLTLKDIISELKKPGRDPRGAAKSFSFDSRIKTIEDVQIGMTIQGLITNITRFGAFVDIGAKQDGLVHISHLANKFVQNPADVVKLNQEVTVKVLEVDVRRNRINLSMKDVN